jgi:7,8-dihydropterin-6-yl-methyl-4-(beta-D-ribofuranosyl)aminobenzene 5'-phosphate synthase
MNIKILFDNQAREGFESGWGFSALIDNTTLFDTGGNTVSLRNNLNQFGIDLSSIKRIVLSHEHWDHTGGISIIKELGAVQTYIPAAFSTRFKNHIMSLNPKTEIIEVKNFTEIDSSLAVTGQLGVMIKEIALAVRTDKGVMVIVGCSHPGVDKLMAAASEFGKLYGVVGGFHGFNRLKELAGLSVIIPTHCTQKKDEIKEMYPDKTRFTAAGDQIDL